MSIFHAIALANKAPSIGTTIRATMGVVFPLSNKATTTKTVNKPIKLNMKIPYKLCKYRITI